MSSTFWHQWHRDYDDPESSLSRRLAVVQDQLGAALATIRPSVDRRLRLIVPGDQSRPNDPSELVRESFTAAGYQELAFVRPEQHGFRVGSHRWVGSEVPYRGDQRLFEFIRHPESAR